MKSQRSRLTRLSWLLLLILTVALSLSASDWEKKVTEAERSAANPLATDSSAAAAGAQTYTMKCAKCHGENAEGKGHHPSLRSPQAQGLMPGELFWVITHGTGMHGMPGFGKLSDNERWQLVSYIKLLNTTTEKPK